VGNNKSRSHSKFRRFRHSLAWNFRRGRPFAIRPLPNLDRSGTLLPVRAMGLTMSQTVGDFLVERLHAWESVKYSVIPATASTGCSDALNRAEGKIQFIQARHEEMAAFMASAYAKFTGELGVCIATSGPGASHLITGLYDGTASIICRFSRSAGQQAR